MTRHKRKVCPICHGGRKPDDAVFYKGRTYLLCGKCWMDKLMEELKACREQDHKGEFRKIAEEEGL